MPSNVLVSGAGSSEFNGLYTYRGENNGKPYYNLVGEPDSTIIYSIGWGGGSDWAIYDDGTNGALYTSIDDVEFPWLVTSWGEVEGTSPVPTVTEAPAQPTFGLSAETVALITSRFGSVARFLRLRNQGQI